MKKGIERHNGQRPHAQDRVARRTDLPVSTDAFAAMNECWEQWLAGAPALARTNVRETLAAAGLLVDIGAIAAGWPGRNLAPAQIAAMRE